MNTPNIPPDGSLIKFLTGSLAGSIYRISKPSITIGRNPGNDIVIRDDLSHKPIASLSSANSTSSIVLSFFSYTSLFLYETNAASR